MDLGPWARFYKWAMVEARGTRGGLWEATAAEEQQLLRQEEGESDGGIAKYI